MNIAGEHLMTYKQGWPVRMHNYIIKSTAFVHNRGQPTGIGNLILTNTQLNMLA